MARIYNDVSPLAAIVGGAFEGLDYANKRKDRKFDEREKVNEAKSSREEFASEKVKGYRTPKYDKDGNFLGYIENEEAKARNRPIQRTLAPQFSERIVQPEKEAEVSELLPENAIKPKEEGIEYTPSGKPIKTFFESTPQTQAPTPASPPGAPKPLLKDKDQEKLLAQTANEVIKVKGAAAQADSIVPGEKAYAGKNPEGVDTYVQNVAKSKQSLPGLELSGSPAQPEIKEEYNPTPEMLAAIDERITSPAKADSDRLIPVSSIPIAIQQKLGIEGMREIPASVFKGLLEFNKPTRANTPQSQLSPETYDAIAAVEGGVPVSTAARQLAERQGFAPLPQQMQHLNSAANRRTGNINREYRIVARGDARADKQEEKLDRSVERFQKAYSGTGVLDALPFLQALERETGVVTGINVDKKKLPGAATNVVRSIPLIGNSAALAMAKSYKGGAAAQALQGLLNAQIKNLSGAAVSSYEQGRNLVQAGMAPGGNEEDVARGIQMMLAGLKEADTSVRAGFDPQVISTYESRGGQVPVVDKIMRDESASRDKRGKGPSQKQVGEMKDIMAAATKKMKELDARTDLNPSEKRAFKAQVAERFESITGVPWGRKDGKDVP